MVRASGVTRLEDRQVAAATTTTTSTSTRTQGQPFTTVKNNNRPGYVEFDTNFTSVTLLGTWGISNDYWVAYFTSTMGWSSGIAPLTTRFTPPTSCATEYIIRETAPAVTYVFVGSTSSCYPPGYLSITYYSPGICPIGYTIAESSTQTVFNRPITETQAYCCPTGYGVRPDSLTPSSSGCFSSINFPDATSTKVSWSVPALFRSYYTPSPSQGTPYSAIRTAMSGTGPVQFVVTPVSIRWQATDKAVMDWLSTTMSSGRNSNSTDATPTSALAHNTGLNTGALVGAIIGGLAVFGLIIAGAIVFLVRRRGGQPVPSRDPEFEHASPAPAPYHDSQGMYSVHGASKYELDAQQAARAGVAHELAAQQQEGTPMLSTGYSPNAPYSRSHSSLARDRLDREGERPRDAPN
ncbi:hypothetical protein EJ06DRAFT_531632 [Trichodelitschia bisporula]|uniref:Uncharacterized protein n=1 Tax=Trichodelitschia bisporula TaxID=703511 RepID=A0A6G1HTI1_9PEZI|nr:hypothetical protein EJ06DRAFT_531632 [Trichodelitschia bisporula]